MLIHIVKSKNNTWRSWICKKAYTSIHDALDAAAAEGDDEAGNPLGAVMSVELISKSKAINCMCTVWCDGVCKNER